MNLSEIYLAAADYIENHGLTHGTLQDNTGAVCVIGALQAVRNLPMDYPEGKDEAVETLAKFLGLELELEVADDEENDPVDFLWSWNDQMLSSEPFGYRIDAKQAAETLKQAAAYVNV